MRRLGLLVPVAVIACSLANRPEDPFEDDNGGGSSTTTTSTSTSSTGGSAACGDGALAAAEACDDGNNAGGDGCDASCAIEGSCARPLPIALRMQGSELVGEISAALGGVSQVDAAPCGARRSGAGSDRVYQIETIDVSRITATASGGFDKAVRILAAPCDVGSELPGGCASGSADAAASADVVAGTYFVLVDSSTSDTQPFTLTIRVGPPSSCQPIFQAGLPDGPYPIDNGGLKTVYCAAGVTYEAFGFGPYNVQFPNFQLLGINDFNDPRVQNAFIWHYNNFGGFQNLSPGFNSGNCCLRLADTAGYLNFGDPAEPGRVYPANQNCTNNCSAGYTDALMRFHRSAAPCEPMLAPNYFQAFPPVSTAGCSDLNNPGFFVHRY